MSYNDSPEIMIRILTILCSVSFFAACARKALREAGIAEDRFPILKIGQTLVRE